MILALRQNVSSGQPGPAAKRARASAEALAQTKTLRGLPYKLPGMAIAAIFIGVSGIMNVSFGYQLGEPSGNALIFAAVAIGIEAYADLAIPLYWRRLRFIGRIGLMAFFLVCLAYKLTAANRFAAENLGKRETAVATAQTSYALAEQRVELLRGRLRDNIDARPADIIETEIARLLRDPATEGCTGPMNGPVTREICPKVDRLRSELARVKTRDTAQSELADAIRALDGVPVVAAAAVKPDAGPVAFLLGLVAGLIMTIVEAGAILVPMLVGFAAAANPRDERAEPLVSPSPAEPSPERAESSPKIAPKKPTTRTEQDAAEFIAFLGQRTERDRGEMVQSTTLYLIYCDWKQGVDGKGGTSMSINQFGTVLTHHVGLTKVKTGGRTYYQNIRLASSLAGSQNARHLRAVPGKTR